MSYVLPPASSLLQPDEIRFVTLGDVQARRQQLIDYVWVGTGLPKRSDLLSRNNGFTTREFDFGPGSNLSSIDELWLDMGSGMRAGAYLLHPRESNGCLFVYHSGHSPSPGAEDYGMNAGGIGEPHYGLVIPILAQCGFTVLTLSMPIYGAWRTPTIDGVQVTSHDQLFDLVQNPWPYFFEPITVFLNLLGPFRCISMMGLSGGGWTTTLYAAMDPRIQRSYPVAGTVPIWLRPPLEALADAEQVWEPLYSIANYSELYVMGACGEGRKQIQCLNQRDPQCFSGTRHTQWVPKVKAALAALGAGEYDFYLDETNPRHSISKAILVRILTDHSDMIDIERLLKTVIWR